MFFRRLATWELSNRAVILGAVAVLTLLSFIALPSLRYEFRPEALTHFSQEEMDFHAEFTREFNLPPAELIIVLDHPEPGAALTETGLTLLYQLTELVDADPISENVVSLVRIPRPTLSTGVKVFFGSEPESVVSELPVTADDVEAARSQVENSHILPGGLISPDASAALIVIELPPELDDTHKLQPRIAELSEQVDALLQDSGYAGTLRDGQASNGYVARFGGLPFVRVAVTNDLQRSQLIFSSLIAAVYFLLLLIIFRRFALAALPLLAVGLATLWTVSLLPVFGLQINIINTMLPTLILVVGVCNAIHVLLRIVDERKTGKSRRDAIIDGIRQLGMACLLTSLTTAVGFFSLILAHAPLLREFGLLVALGIMLSYIAIMTALPVGASFFTLASKRSIRAEHAERAARDGDEDDSAQAADPTTLPAPPRTFSDKVEDALGTLTDVILRHRVPVLIASLLFTAGALYLGSLVNVDARALEGFEEGHPVYETNQVIEEKLGGILPLEIVLSSDTPRALSRAETLAAIADFQRDIADVPGVLSSLSVVDMLIEIPASQGTDTQANPPNPTQLATSLTFLRSYQPQGVARYLNADSTRARITARLADLGIQQILDAIETIREAAHTHLEPHGVNIRLTGTAYLASAGLDTFVRDLYYSLIMASAIIFLIVTLTFRSLRVGLISVLPNAIPLASTLACIYLFGYDLNASTVLVLTISIGLAVDNTIHFISRFIEEIREGADEDAAIRGTFQHAGRAIIYSNLLLMVGFSTLVLSAFPPSRKTAVLTVSAIGVAMVAAIITLPVLLVLFGRPVFKRYQTQRLPSSAEAEA